jgi:hypothetical protein
MHSAGSALRCGLRAAWQRTPRRPPFGVGWRHRGAATTASSAAAPPPPPPHRLAAPLRVAVLNSPGNDPYAPMFRRFLESGLAQDSKPLLTVSH